MPSFPRVRCRLPAHLLPVASVLFLCACGDPKTATPLPEPPAIDLAGVRGPELAITLAGQPEHVELTAPAGAVPPGATVHVTDLDGADPVVATTAAVDGSFMVSVLLTPGDELRFQAIASGVRGAPLDARYESNGALTPSVRPDCVGIDPGFELDFSGGIANQSATITNSCADVITVSGSTLRLGLPEFTAEAVTAGPVPMGAATTRSASYTPSTRVEREDVMFVDITTGGATVRYAFTLHGN